MGEEEAINKIEDSGAPLTITSLKAAFRKLGVKPGMTLLLHSSLSSLGWVCGGAVAVILALEEILGADGTLVMPTFSTNLSDPSQWHNPQVPESWWVTIRNEMPPYDREFTPTRGVGIIPETFRKQTGVIRSNHSQLSFAARSNYAVKIMADHSLDYPFGDGSPLARVYDLDGWILLLGTSYKSNSSFHLAEYRAQYSGKTVEYHRAPIMVNSCRKWQQMEDFKPSDSDFNEIGDCFERGCPKEISLSTIWQGKNPARSPERHRRLRCRLVARKSKGDYRLMMVIMVFKL